MRISEKTIKSFLDASGWGSATRKKLAQDASFRSYQHLTKPERSAVLMLAPPAKEQTIHYVAVGKYLLQNGFSAPKIYARDSKAGLLLIEDFGNNLLKTVIKKEPNVEFEHYKLAVDLLIRLQKQTPPNELSVSENTTHPLPVYNKELLHTEVNLFTDFYLDKGLGISGQYNWDEWENIWAKIFNKLAKPHVLSLRDYHAENIMMLDREGVKKLGLLDFQDAAIGHKTYDLVSLLQDARRNVSQEIEEKLVEHFINAHKANMSPLDSNKTIEEYNILGAQRNIKIIGIFTRLWARDGKKQYLQMIPHVWKMLERNLSHKSLQPLKIWLDTNIQAQERSKIITDKK